MTDLRSGAPAARKGRSSHSKKRLARWRRKALAETLEPRHLLAMITVDSLSDTVAADGVVTLREAIQAANTNAVVHDAAAGDALPVIDRINFAPSLFSKVIRLGGTELSVTESVNITTGSPRLGVTIDAEDNSRVFNIGGAGENTFTLQGLTIQNGNVSGNGGGVLFAGSDSDNNDRLEIVNTTLLSNTATGDGGGLYAFGNTVDIRDSALVSNQGTYGGGAALGGGNFSVLNSTFSFNTATHSGGAIDHTSESLLSVANSTFAGNSSANSEFGDRDFCERA